MNSLQSSQHFRGELKSKFLIDQNIYSHLTYHLCWQIKGIVIFSCEVCHFLVIIKEVNSSTMGFIHGYHAQCYPPSSR